MLLIMILRRQTIFYHQEARLQSFSVFSQSLLCKMDADQVFLTREVYAKTEA